VDERTCGRFVNIKYEDDMNLADILAVINGPTWWVIDDGLGMDCCRTSRKVRRSTLRRVILQTWRSIMGLMGR